MLLLNKKILSCITFILIISEVCSECSNMRMRRNFASLSKSERDEYVDAFQQMYRNGTFDRLAYIYASEFRSTHRSQIFLSWHRRFIHDFETRMMSINPNLTLPYWDAADDFEAPHEAEVFSSDVFGGNGSPENNLCVKDGFLGNETINYPWRHCLKRDFQGDSPNTIHPWHSPAFVTSLIQTSSNSDELSQNLEHSLHYSMLFSVSGLNGDLSQVYSPMDPIFWLHHSSVDRIFTMWQLSQSSNGQAGNARVIEEPLCYSYDDIISERPQLATAVENRFRQLPKKLLKKYFPKFYAGEEADMNHDFFDIQSLSASLDKPLPSPLVIPKEFYERLGLNATLGRTIQKRALKFVRDMNAYHESD